MNNFYKVFIESYFTGLHTKQNTYYSIFRKDLSKRAKYIYYYSRLVQILSNCFSYITKKRLTKVDFEATLFNKRSFVINNLSEFEDSYELLLDDESKRRFISYIAFKSLDSFLHRLPFDYKNLEKNIKMAKELKVSNTEDLYDLANMGINIKLIGDELGVIFDFIEEQYAYKEIVQVEKDDIVIDCGGATGDTALYFCSKGAEKVFVFEFIKSSLLKIEQQIQNNLQFNKQIKIVNNAVWNTSNEELSYMDRGNASIVGNKNIYPNKVVTKSIDSLVKEENTLIDFIKMDIEGAEYEALLGASKTISKQKPKLAISVYHKENDLINIPLLLKKLNPDYEFYFDYYTDTGAEAILYTINKSY